MVASLLTKRELENFIPHTLVQLLELHSSVMQVLLEDNVLNLIVISS